MDSTEAEDFLLTIIGNVTNELYDATLALDAIDERGADELVDVILAVAKSDYEGQTSVELSERLDMMIHRLAS